MKQYKKSRYKQ